MNNNIIIVLLFFLVSSSSLSCSSVFLTAHAQSPSPITNNYIASSKDNRMTTRTTLPMLLIVFIFAFFITAFCSIYTQYCSPHNLNHALPHPTRRGIDPRVLATCPLIPYLKTKPFRQNGASQCSVCLAEFSDGDALRLLPRCGHVFHAPCIDTWLDAHVTCPVCRDEVGAETEGEPRAMQVFDESFVREEEEEEGEKVKMLRSHSTGHSLEGFIAVNVEEEEKEEEELVKKIVENGSVVTRMKRSMSYDVVLRSVEEGEGSNSSNSKWMNNKKWWILSMTPPFVSRAPIVREEKEYEGRTVFELV